MKTQKKLEEYKKLLLVVDMVKGFITEGSLEDPTVGHIIPEVEKLIQKFLNEEEAIFFIKDTHTEESAEFKSFPVHCLKGTKEAELVDKLLPYERRENTYSIEKNSTSAIFAPGFMEKISQMKNINQIVGCGCEKDICVPNVLIPLKNYYNEKNQNVDIIVPENAVETYDAPWHPREKYAEAGEMLMIQSGIAFVKKI